MNVKVIDIIGTSIAISTDKGKVLLNAIQNSLHNDSTVIVDFEGISDLTTAFLNVAIGHLYNDFSGKELNEKLIIKNLDELDMYLVAQVIERVKLNQQKEGEEEFNKLISEVLDDDENS